MVSVVPALIGGVATLGGLLFLYAGGQKYRRSRQRRSMDPIPVADLRPDMGLVEVEGSARPARTATLDAEAVDGDALVRYRTVERSTDDTGWTVVESELESVPTAVEDDTGSVEVDLPDVTVSNNQPTQFLSGSGIGDPNLTLDPEQFDGEYSDWPTTLGVDRGVLEDEIVRFREGAIGVGEEIYVSGVPERSAGETVITTGDEPGEFVLADGTESEFESDTRLEPLLFFGLGVVLTLFGALFVIVGAGGV